MFTGCIDLGSRLTFFLVPLFLHLSNVDTSNSTSLVRRWILSPQASACHLELNCNPVRKAAPKPVPRTSDELTSEERTNKNSQESYTLLGPDITRNKGPQREVFQRNLGGRGKKKAELFIGHSLE